MAYLFVDLDFPTVVLVREFTRIAIQPDAPVMQTSGQLWPRSKSLTEA